MDRIPRSRYTPEQYAQRPREFDPAVADTILDRISSGELLTEICADRDMPMPGTFLRWCEDDPALGAKMESAERRGMRILADEVVMQAHEGNPSTAGARSRALQWYVVAGYPEKYAPRSVTQNKNPEENLGGGIDYGAELRRRLDSMARRTAEETKS